MKDYDLKDCKYINLNNQLCRDCQDKCTYVCCTDHFHYFHATLDLLGFTVVPTNSPGISMNIRQVLVVGGKWRTL